ncbi:MAG: hypothetical protein EOO60_04930 [Hymenobacter sp.]|nr:MAG: hypothetical protein EOO60_04930 [Hymenobacter sp.]
MIDTYVKVGGQYQPATMTLATPEEMEQLDTWLDTYASDTTKGTVDALEYVDSSLEKHEKYTAYDRCPSAWLDFIDLASRDVEDEVAGLFVLKCGLLANEILGFTFIRRNWDNSMVMDYLARCPKSNKKLEQVSTIGVGLLFAICMLADRIGSPYFWWETTPLSYEFYHDILNLAGVATRKDAPKSMLVVPRDSYLRLMTYLDSRHKT